MDNQVGQFSTGAFPSPNPEPVNLTPTEAPSGPPIEGVAGEERSWTVIFAIVTIIVTLLGSFILYFLVVTAKAKVRTTQTKIDELTRTLASEPLASLDRQATALAASLAGYKTALANVRDYTKLLDEVNALTPKDVKISSLGLDDKGEIRFTASSSNLISAGRTFYSYRKSKIFSGITFQAISLSTKDNSLKVDFIISGSVNRQNLGSPTPSP